MKAALGPIGFHTFLAWGGLSHWEKREFFKNLYQGRCQVVITTAEFLETNLAMFLPAAARIRLFVVDEAHHLAANDRQSYKRLHQTWRRLGCPRFFRCHGYGGYRLRRPHHEEFCRRVSAYRSVLPG